MKGMFKRALAGVAAAALATTGLAALSGAASADPSDDATITVNNAQEGHTYTAYKFANLVNARTEGSPAVTYVDVQTVPEYVNAVRSAADAADNGASDSSVPAQYQSNPAAYVATFGTKQLADFAEALTDLLPVTGAPDGVTAVNGVITDTEGWFAVTDTAGGDSAGPTAIVASTVAGAENLTIDTSEGQKNITAIGSFNAKSENAPTKPDKTGENITVTDTEGNTVNVGDQIRYTITYKVPMSANGFDNYPVTFTDTASKGLAVPGQEGFTATVDAEVLAITGFEQTSPSDGSADTTTTFTVNAAGKGGKTIAVTYAATVTKAVLEGAESVINADGSVTNKATVTTNGGTSDEGKTEHKTHDFQFAKVGSDKQTPLSGVTFNIYRGTTVTGNPLKFDIDGVLSAEGNADLTTEEDGIIAVKGLSAGKYTVKETATNTASGYSDQFLATFTIEINADGAYVLTEDNNGLDLAWTADDGTIKVMNVKSVTQLPLTGAAGTALFTVLGLLIAGAGALAYMKSRNVKHALRG